MNNENRIGHIIYKCAAWGWLIGGYLWNIWYQAFRGENMLDSDISGEMLLADLLNKEHSVIGMSKEWIYSTGTRFLETQWLFRLGLMIFPNDWHGARIFATAILLAMLAFGTWLIFYSIGRSEWGIWAAALALFPGGGWYFWQTLFGGQYTPYIIISLVSFSLIVMACNNWDKRKRIFYIASIILIGVGAGMNGIKQLMVFYAPLCITGIIALAKTARECGREAFANRKIFNTNGFRYSILITIASAAAFVGYLINTHILVNVLMFETYEETLIEYQDFLSCLKMFIWNYGFASGKPLMSPEGISSMCGVLLGLFVVFSGIRLVMRINSLSDDEQMLCLVAVISILFCCFIFSYLSSQGDIQYFQPVVPFGYILVVMEIFTEQWWSEGAGVSEICKRKTAIVMMNLAMIIMLIVSAGTIHNEANTPFHKYRARPALKQVVNMLVEKGYTKGVSQFWTSNVITELSDGMIEMWTLSYDSPDVWEKRLQKRNHLEGAPEGKYFYLFDLTRGEEEAYIDLGLAYIDAHHEAGVPIPIYYDDNFIVYGN